MAAIAIQHIGHLYTAGKMNKQIIINAKETILPHDGKYEEIPKSRAGKQIWQVFYLPLDLLNGICPQVVAFCPFTKVFGIGNDIREASRSWSTNAKKRFGKPFLIPKYLSTSRKVYYGVNRRPLNLPLQDDPLDITTSSESLTGSGEEIAADISEDIPIFILDFSFVEDAVAVCPKTLKYVDGSINEWKNNSPQNSPKFLPSIWMEWRVQCTPIMEVNQSNTSRERETLTPNSIN